MSLDAHITELKRKHSDLSAKIDKSQHTPAVNQRELVSLKKQKLLLKEQIERLSAD